VIEIIRVGSVPKKIMGEAILRMPMSLLLVMVVIMVILIVAVIYRSSGERCVGRGFVPFWKKSLVVHHLSSPLLGIEINGQNVAT
jgi:hypothetical protein